MNVQLKVSDQNIAGRLEQFIPFWQSLTSDSYILSIVKGLELEFVNNEVPKQTQLPKLIKFSDIESSHIDVEIQRLLHKGVLVESKHEQGEFVNNIFTRPKKDGTRRMILNLKPLNQHIAYHKFKMDTLKTVLRLVHKNCYMVNLDIRDAYYMVRIHENHQKYLKFPWQNKLFQYTALPNGYAAAPRVFTKLLKPVFSQLRQSGVTVMGYIDDVYIQGDSVDECYHAMLETRRVLESCGFLIHEGKSVLEPTRNLTFLGFDINTMDMTVKLTQSKCHAYLDMCKDMLRKDRVSIREIAQLIGKLVSTFPGVQYGPLHYRILDAHKIQALKDNANEYDKKMNLTCDMKDEIQWWVENLATSMNHIGRGTPHIEVQTDATLTAWGAVCGQSRTGGKFSLNEQYQLQGNINAFEILAIDLALKAFVKLLTGKVVLIRSDNTVAVSYISHMGGSKSSLCNKLVKDIWLWCIQHDIWLTAEHLPGIMNIDADWESRNVNDRTEWSLCPAVFHKIIERFGTPEIDLFASRLNHKLPRYVSWRPEPGAECCNAFSMSWTDIYAYVFPPFSLIAQVLQKIRHEGAEVLLIVPLWTTQPWFSPLLEMLIESPALLPQKQKLLKLPHQPEKRHPLEQQLKLIICRLSGKAYKQAAFRKRLSISSAIPGGKARGSSTGFTSRDGMRFQVKGTSIIINPL